MTLYSLYPQISMGLGFSTILFLLAITLIMGVKDQSNSIDTSGMLQTIWLLRNKPELQSGITQVKIPLSENLRIAGMLEATLGEDSNIQSHTWSYYCPRGLLYLWGFKNQTVRYKSQIIYNYTYACSVY